MKIRTGAGAAGGGGMTDAEFTAHLPLPVTGPLTDAQLRATPVPVDTELAPAVVLADAMANPTVPRIGSDLLLWNGATWDRARSGSDASDAVGTFPFGILIANSRLTGLNSSGFWDRIRSARNNTDSEVTTATGNLQSIAYLFGWSGIGWDRLRSKIAAGLAVEPTPATNNIQVNGAANAIATATLPAPGVGNFHYITGIDIQRHSTAALAGGATLAVTTTNLGGRSWRTSNQASITVSTMNGGRLVDKQFLHPLKSAVANTASTIVCPAAGAAVLWTINVDYYIAP